MLDAISYNVTLDEERAPGRQRFTAPVPRTFDRRLSALHVVNPEPLALHPKPYTPNPHCRWACSTNVGVQVSFLVAVTGAVLLWTLVYMYMQANRNHEDDWKTVWYQRLDNFSALIKNAVHTLPGP